MEPELSGLANAVAAARAGVDPRRALLVALSGIDASGKGFIAARLRELLAQGGLRAGVVGADGWLRPPAERFSEREPGRRFYERALRFEELFERLVLPLRARRSIRLEAELLEETAATPRPHVWEYRDLDVVLLEGVFLLKRAFQDGRYDLAVWVDCGFETALERAIARAQEGLDPGATARAYRTIYFPAQELHLALDRPREAADWIVPNDPRLGGGGA